MADKAVTVRKVRPFPFPVVFKTPSIQFSGLVVNMNKYGILAEASSSLVAVGDHIEVQFEIPVMHHLITTQGVVVKVLKQMTGIQTSNMTIEVHYKALSEVDRQRLEHFMRAAKLKI